MLRPVHVLAATFVVVAGIQSFGQTKPDLIARIGLLNQELLQLSARPPQSVLDRVRTVIRLRIEAFQALALIDPSRALAMTLGNRPAHVCGVSQQTLRTTSNRKAI